MDLSSKGAAFLRAHEGFVPRHYLDPIGVGTIGIGFTWRSDAFREWWAKNKLGVEFGPGATITREEAEDALIYLCRHEYGAAVNRFLGRKKPPQHVFDGTVSPVYNLGEDSLDWRWAAAVKAGDYARAADLLAVTGTTADGRELRGLVKRRKDEAELIEFGDYVIGPMPVDAMADGVLVRGERGPEVRVLIRDLARLGFYDGVMDDVFGYGTEAAVLAFQRAHGLKDDGYAGPKTLAAIAAAIAGRASADIPIPTAKPEEAPMPAPPMPAPIGHNGGPAFEPTSRPSPMDQVRKPNGGAKWASVVGAIWVAVVSTGHVPPEFTTPEMLAAVTVIVTVVANWIGTYRAPKNAE